MASIETTNKVAELPAVAVQKAPARLPLVLPVSQLRDADPTIEEAAMEEVIRAHIILFPISEYQILDIVVIENPQGRLMCSVSSVCNALEIAYQEQITIINEHDEWMSGLHTVQIPDDVQVRKMFFIEVQYLQAWLYGISRNRVCERARPTLVKLQEKISDVIREHFSPAAPAIDLQGLLAQMAQMIVVTTEANRLAALELATAEVRKREGNLQTTTETALVRNLEGSPETTTVRIVVQHF